MEVGAVDAPGAAALEAGHAVVAEPRDDAAERLGAVVEDRAAGVVLEAGERLAGPGAVEQDVADHPPLAGDGVERQQPDARAARARRGRGRSGRAAGSRRRRRGTRRRRSTASRERAALRREIGRDELLLAVLAAADVEEVDRRPGPASPSPIATHLELVAARARRAPSSTAMFPRSA